LINIKKMQIKTAEHAGTCFGVKNAIDIAFEAAERTNGNNTYIMGELVHNPQVVADLQSKGVKTIKNINELKQGDNLIIRAHGELKQVYDYCEENKINLIDASCPFVKKAQTLAQKLEKDGYQVVLLGDINHPEVRAIIDRTEHAIVIPDPDNMNNNEIKKHNKIGILSQTTQPREKLNKLILNILDHQKEIKIHNTICNATSNRQKSAISLCSESDLMIVIGGKNSANTKNLFEICSNNIKTYWISDKDELKKEWFNNINAVGITAGASTPDYVIKEVIEKIKSF